MSNYSREYPVNSANNLTEEEALRTGLGNSFAESAAIADVYDRQRPGYPREIVDKILAYSGFPASPGGYQSAPDVLDIGCGTGIGTLPFVEAGCNIYAIDPSPAFIATARDKFRAYTNVHFEEAKLEELIAAGCVTSHSYDIAVAAQSFHWLPKDKWQLAHSVLRQNGVLALMSNFPETEEAANPDSAREKAVRQLYLQDCPKFPAVNYGSLDSMVAEQAGSGLYGPAKTTSARHDKTYDVDGYLDFQRSLSWVDALPATQQRSFIEKVKDLVNPDDAGHVVLPFKTIAFMARVLPIPEI